MAQDQENQAASTAEGSLEGAPTAASKRAETVVMSLSDSAAGADEQRGDISASTIARMMGLATVSETKLVEGKIDLLATKISTLQVKIEKALSILGNVPTGADLERIDVQIGALRQLIREVVSKEAEKQADAAASDGAKKPGGRIQTNS